RPRFASQYHLPTGIVGNSHDFCADRAGRQFPGKRHILVNGRGDNIDGCGGSIKIVQRNLFP
ncbi:MAG: hypothetical protein ACI31E_00470, partial [Muribaculaceae bacterium]